MPAQVCDAWYSLRAKGLVQFFIFPNLSIIICLLSQSSLWNGFWIKASFLITLTTNLSDLICSFKWLILGPFSSIWLKRGCCCPTSSVNCVFMIGNEWRGSLMWPASEVSQLCDIFTYGWKMLAAVSWTWINLLNLNGIIHWQWRAWFTLPTSRLKGLLEGL